MSTPGSGPPAGEAGLRDRDQLPGRSAGRSAGQLAVLGGDGEAPATRPPAQPAPAQPPGPPPDGSPRRPAATYERRWVLLVWLLALVIFLATDAGRMIFDSKLGVDVNAAGFYARLWPLWNPLAWLGTLQDQYIGYAIPMAPFFLAGQLLHVPVWIIERLWLSLLVAAGFAGVVRLAAALRIGSAGSRLLAGAVFALWPTFTIVIGSTSAAVLPGVLAPWAVLPLVAAVNGRSPAILAAARSGVAVMLMAGVNAASTLTALVLPALYILTHTKGRQRGWLCLWWGAAVVAATAWWLIPLLLQGRYSFNFLPYVEQAATTTGTASATAFLRGSSNWTAYFNLGTPWLPAGWAMVASPAGILASAAAAATGLYGLARRDMPQRRWLCLSLALAAAVALAGYWGPLGGPLHGPVDQLLDGPLAPLRSVYKLEPAVAVALALGCAHAIGRCWTGTVRLPGRPGRIAASVVTAPLVALVLAGLAVPYLTGQILQPGSFTSVPGYWSRVAGFLARHSPAQTALVIPADSHGQYLWGDPIDDPLESLASSPWAERALVPYGGAGSQVMLDTAETAFESGQPVPGLAAYLSRAGIRYVVVRNDLNPDVLGYTPPQEVHATLDLSGFRRVAAFGPPTAAPPVNPPVPWPAIGSQPSYPAVEVYQAADPVDQPPGPVSALAVSKTVLVNGGPDSLLQLAGQHLLHSSQPAVIAGDPLTGAPALWAVTDGQRRANNAFGVVNSNISFTYTATQRNPVDNALGRPGQPPSQILPVPAAGHQTVAVLSGAAQVTASSYGSWLTEQPQADPVNAFDGNPATAWVEGSATTPAGQWIQITFGHQLNLPASIGVRLLDDIPSRPVADQLRVSTAAGSVTTTLPPASGTQRLGVAAGPSSWLRVTIAGASGVIPGSPGAGISDLLIPGVHVTSYLQPPQAAAGQQAPSAAYSFQLQSPMISDQSSPAAGLPLARTFSTAAAQQLTVTAAAVARPGPALERILARLTPASRAGLAISASSTWNSDPRFGPANLFTGSGTPWIAGRPAATLRLSWHGRRRITKLVLTPALGLPVPVTVELGSPAGFRQEPVGPGGVVLVKPPLSTSRLYLAFPGMRAAPVNPATGLPGQAAFALAGLSIPALSGLHADAPDRRSRFTLGCGQGPAVTIDGRHYQTAVSGTVGQLVDFLPVRLRLCAAGSVADLAAGRHWLLAAPSTAFTVTGMSLLSGPALAPASAVTRAPGQAAAAQPRALAVRSWQPDNRTVSIGPGPAAYVEIHQNANSGWVATLNGRRLTPARLDGWQQAYIVPAGSGGLIKMSYAPAAIYHAGIVLSGLALIVLLAAAAGFRRRKMRAGHPAAELPASELPALIAGTAQTEAAPDTAAGLLGAARYLSSPAGRRWAALILLTAVIFLAGGPAAIAVPVLAVIAVRWPRWLPAIAFCAMLSAGVAAAATAQPTALGSGAFGGPAQACALIALAAALMPVIGIPAARPPRAQPGGTP